MNALKRFCLAALLAMVTGLFASVSHHADQAPLSPQGQSAFNKGVAAADKKDWAEAIKQFTEAQKLDPTSPGVLFNLGLANSEIGGRDVVAICWLEAYLAAAPQAANREQVRKHIKTLEVKVENQIQLLVAGGIRTAALTSSDPRTLGFLATFSFSQMKIGDFAGAKRTADKLPAVEPEVQTTYWVTPRWKMYVKIGHQQLDDVDVEGARQTFAQAKEACARLSLWRELGEIAALQAQAGDVVEALETLALVPMARLNYADCSAVARAQAKKSGPAAARPTFAKAVAAAMQIKSPESRAEALRVVADTQIEAGDVDAARKTLLGAVEAAGQISEVTTALQRYSSILEMRIKAGALDEARATLARAVILESAFQYQDFYVMYRRMAQTLKTVKRLDGALELLNQASKSSEKISDPRSLIPAQCEIAKGLAAVGDQEAARHLLALALKATNGMPPDYRGSPSYYYRLIASAQAAMGERDAARQTFNLALNAPTPRSNWEEALIAAGAKVKVSEERPVDVHRHLEIAENQAEVGELEGAHQTLLKAFAGIDRKGGNGGEYFSVWRALHKVGILSETRQAARIGEIEDWERLARSITGGRSFDSDLRQSAASQITDLLTIEIMVDHLANDLGTIRTARTDWERRWAGFK